MNPPSPDPKSAPNSSQQGSTLTPTGSVDELYEEIITPGIHHTFKVVALTQAEEDAYDCVKHRTGIKLTGFIGSVAHIVKGALGAGILSGHVAYMHAGVYVSVPVTILVGIYLGYCAILLADAAQVMYKRLNLPSMSYPDVGEAAVCCFPNRKVSKYSKQVRYLIDAFIVLDLFGACTCYQVIIAKSIKQLVEDTQSTSIHGIGEGYPGIRVYLAVMILPIIGICLIRHLKWLAPFSLLANFIIVLCIAMTVKYAFIRNPTFSNMRTHNTLASVFELLGNIVFGMSCSGVVLPIENHMQDPKKFSSALSVAMVFVVTAEIMVAFFGYAGYLEHCESPITVNFPMTFFPKVLKGLIAVMLFITHALNFWVPFNLIFHYVKKHHSGNLVMWESIYRAMFVVMIALIAIAFPDVNALIGFIGAFCLSNMAIIMPNFISLLVVWDRPGLGKYKWRLWRSILLIITGFIVLICGSYVSGGQLLEAMYQ